jgi:hypothetical protein
MRDPALVSHANHFGTVEVGHPSEELCRYGLKLKPEA